MLQTAQSFWSSKAHHRNDKCVLVAHNADFDYRILQTEFRRLGTISMQKRHSAQLSCLRN
jgi:DNA polymerase-3 subunit epsilon